MESLRRQTKSNKCLEVQWMVAKYRSKSVVRVFVGYFGHQLEDSRTLTFTVLAIAMTECVEPCPGRMATFVRMPKQKNMETLHYFTAKCQMLSVAVGVQNFTADI